MSEEQSAKPVEPLRAARWMTDYWSQSRRPLVSLAFTAPLLVIYEASVLCLGRNAVRNGADAWLRQVLDTLGFSQYLLLPLLTVGILLGWHHVTRQPWRLSRYVLYAMLAESIVLAMVLRMILRLQGLLMQTLGAVRVSLGQKCAALAGFLGAGVYEELLFRLMLLSAGIGLLRWLRVKPRASQIGGIIATSLLFALAHYKFVNASGDDFTWFTFLFRFMAGVFFSILFLHRGFGIAAGTHAAYDVIVGFTR